MRSSSSVFKGGVSRSTLCSLPSLVNATKSDHTCSQSCFILNQNIAPTDSRSQVEAFHVTYYSILQLEMWETESGAFCKQPRALPWGHPPKSQCTNVNAFQEAKTQETSGRAGIWGNAWSSCCEMHANVFSSRL